MKNYFTYLLLFLFVQEATSTTFYQQLCQFNENWKKYEHKAPKGEAQIFNNDKEYIQAHLSSVLPILRNNPVSHLNAEQLTNRMQLIDVLDDYRIVGQFPINYYRQERIPVFIDEHDTHCAVGYLLKESGHGAMAKEIAASNNYAWLKNIHHTDFSEWQIKSGFSIEELKLIQGAYDYYMPNARFVANKYEIPQKPECVTLYFDGKSIKRSYKSKKENIWCHGEGRNGILNGRWEQNFAAGIPWIEGYFENGKRTGQWKEYYQGTNKLCRTENWRNDKLNGVRKRFNMRGVLIEEILFKDGAAISKINYDHLGSLKWIRKPIDSITMQTEVYTFGGSLIAFGKEKVHNPGNLLWFQNIELTALNSAAITSRDQSVSQEAFFINGSNNGGLRSFSSLYNSPPLVKYKKEGEWTYYKEFGKQNENTSNKIEAVFKRDYHHFGVVLYQSIRRFDNLDVKVGYDSIQVVYKNDHLEHFYGFGDENFVHLHIAYHEVEELELLSFNILSYRGYDPRRKTEMERKIEQLGQFNKNNQKVGLWKHFDKNNRLYKTENYILPWKDEEEIVGLESY